MLNTYTIRMNPSLRILEFKDMTEEWPDLNVPPIKSNFVHLFSLFHMRSDWIYGTNKRKDVINTLGQAAITKIYRLADVYHSDKIDTVGDRNSSFHYDAPQNILNAYLYHEIE